MFSRFGDGYTVTLRIGGENPDLEGVSELIESLFPAAVLKVLLSYYHPRYYPWFHFTPQFVLLPIHYLIIARQQLEPTFCLTAYLHTSLPTYLLPSLLIWLPAFVCLSVCFSTWLLAELLAFLAVILCMSVCLSFSVFGSVLPTYLLT